jgi:hypothetical protein
LALIAARRGEQVREESQEADVGTTPARMLSID